MKGSTRRTFVKTLGIGAASLLLNPARFSYAAGQAPFRCLIMMEGNGLIPRFVASNATIAAINAAGGNIGPNDYGDLNNRYAHNSVLQVPNAGLSSASALQSLAPQFSGDLSIEEDTRVVLGLSSKVAGGGHSSHFGALTCSPGAARVPSMPSVDHILGRIPLVRGASPFDVVRLGIQSSTTTPFNYSTCASGDRAPVPLICNPQIAYANLFGSVAPGDSANVFRNQGKLLDFVRADVDATLQELNGKPQLQNKIERYGEAVETLTVRHQTILGMETQLRAVAPDGPGVSPLYASTHSLDHLEAMFDLTKAAFLGGLTNVAVIGSGTGGAFNLNYDRIGLGQIGRHDICHANDYTALNAITSYQVGLVAKLAKDLKATPEGSGNMLDNTVIIYMSDNGEKHHSNSNEWPMLIIGGSNHGFGSGNRSIVYPRVGKANNRQVSNIFSTLTHAAGSGVDNFGNDIRRVASGPLSDLWSA